MNKDAYIPSCEVIRSSRKTISLELTGRGLVLRAPLWATEAQLQRFLREREPTIRRFLARAEAQRARVEAAGRLSPEELESLTRRARDFFPSRAAHYAALLEVGYGRISIRRQRSRWGSCSAEGNLSFNALLMLAPEEVADSVAAHELCHRREMNHSPRFYSLLLEVCPDYRACDKWLKENGPVLLGRMPEKD